MEENTKRFSRFPETRWTLVNQAAEGDEADRAEALGTICACYWPAIYAFIRAQGETSHDAEDLTQAFFAQFVLGDRLSRADPEKGRLRTYLLCSLKNFLHSEHRKASRQKRGGGVRPLSIDSGEGEARYLQIADSEQDLDRVYDRQWATTLMENVMGRLAERYLGKGQGDLFSGLSPFLRAEPDPGDFRRLAVSLGQSEGTLRVALHRLRRRFREDLEAEVGATLSPDDDFSEEMRYLRSVL